MVLNLTRYPNSLILMYQYIAEEQNFLANFQQNNKFESYYQVTLKLPLSSNSIFKKKILINFFFKFKKNVKTNFLKN